MARKVLFAGLRPPQHKRSHNVVLVVRVHVLSRVKRLDFMHGPQFILCSLQKIAQTLCFVFKLVNLFTGLAPLVLFLHEGVEAALEDVVVAFKAVLVTQQLLMLLHLLCLLSRCNTQLLFRDDFSEVFHHAPDVLLRLLIDGQKEA